MDELARYTLMDRDEVNLLALLRTLREAELRASERLETGMHQEVQEAADRHADQRAANALAGIAVEGCARFDGEAPIRSDYRQAKERRYSMYAMHPDTAEQVIKAIEFLIERIGPRYQSPMRAQVIEPKTKRNG